MFIFNTFPPSYSIYFNFAQEKGAEKIDFDN